MPWWKLGLGGAPPSLPKLEPVSLAASANVVPSSETRLLRSYESWQEEAWGYFDNLGEYRYAVEWKAAMLSRVRLFAAEIVPGQDEPVRIEDPNHMAVQALSVMAGGASAQASLMSSLSSQLDVPGEAYLIGETRGGVERWSVRSVGEVQVRRGAYEVVSEDSVQGQLTWRPLGPDSLVGRVYRPHKRWAFLADSPARAARVTMRELEMVNRHILAQYLSRLASAGIVVFPDEISFPVREEFADQPDPFMAEWIEIARMALSEPGTASAVVPIPMRMPGEWIDKVKHLDFTLKIDDKIIEKRDSAIKRLATQVNIPAEVLLGMGDVNHWGQWALEEGALKTSVAPDAEMISGALTELYLQPRLKRSGLDNPESFVVWYDMSELAVRPDRSGNAVQAYDRLEINGEALRRETGFDEADKPSDEELKDQALRIIIKSIPSGAFSALSLLVNDPSISGLGTDPQGGFTSPNTQAPSQAPEEAAPAQEERAAPQAEQSAPEEPPDQAARSRAERLIRQSRAAHAVRFSDVGRWEILHPTSCENHAYSCPYTQKALRSFPHAHPGRSGTYAFSLDSYGRLRIGNPLPHMDTSGMLTTGGINGNR